MESAVYGLMEALRQLHISIRLQQGSTWCTVLSLVLFNLSWFSLVFLTNDGIIPAVLLSLAALVFLPFTSRQLLMSCLIAFLGIGVDSALMMSGMIDFQGTFLPLWLIVLWFCFSLMIHFGLTFLSRFSVIDRALIGAAGGSSSYFAGVKAGSAFFPHSLYFSLMVFALVWAVLLPLFYRLAFSDRKDDQE